ncbi:hypothetical protein SynA1840_00339 [Synechococcus sp. A18-40]|nr:hypothetical protein SynA1840_00339 [Synechococcus sp. A18-40]
MSPLRIFPKIVSSAMAKRSGGGCWCDRRGINPMHHTNS